MLDPTSLITSVTIISGYTLAFFGLAVVLWSIEAGFENTAFRRFSRGYFAILSGYVIFLLTVVIL